MRPTALKLTAGILTFMWFIILLSKLNVEPINVVTTAVPFLRISPDARSGGMGDLGVATSPDAMSGFWNIGKVAFNQSKGGIAATYTPWLKDLVNDVYLASLQVIINLMTTRLSLVHFVISALVIFSSLITSVMILEAFRPREFGIDVGYSRKLSEKWYWCCIEIYQF